MKMAGCKIYLVEETMSHTLRNIASWEKFSHGRMHQIFQVFTKRFDFRKAFGFFWWHETRCYIIPVRRLLWQARKPRCLFETLQTDWLSDQLNCALCRATRVADKKYSLTNTLSLWILTWDRHHLLRILSASQVHLTLFPWAVSKGPWRIKWDSGAENVLRGPYQPPKQWYGMVWYTSRPSNPMRAIPLPSKPLVRPGYDQ